MAGAALYNVYGGVDAAVGHVAVEMEFHIAGALELFVDEVVEAAAGVDECGGDDGKTAAVFTVAGGAEEFLGWV